MRLIERTNSVLSSMCSEAYLWRRKIPNRSGNLTGKCMGLAKLAKVAESRCLSTRNIDKYAIRIGELVLAVAA